MYRLAYNPTDAPMLIDAAGRTLGGGEWGPVSSTADEVKAALEADTLVYVDLADDAEASVPAAAARTRVAELNERTEAFGALDKPELEQLAAELEPADGANKAQLVELLAYSSVALPASEPAGDGQGDAGDEQPEKTTRPRKSTASTATNEGD